MNDSTRMFLNRSGDDYIVGYKCREQVMGNTTCTLKLFKGVIPYVTIDDEIILDFMNSYITIENIHSTNEYAVVTVFARECPICSKSK